MQRADFSLSDIAGSRFPLLEHAPDATVIVDSDGRIRLINAQTENLFGYYREELIGEPIEKLIPSRFHGRHVHDRSRYSQDPRVRPMGAGLELFGQRKDGSEFPVEISLSPVTLREGTFVSAAIRDVTQRKAFEAKLKELNVELEDASRAKDRFLASMSHELRTPLNAIIGFTGTLLMGLPGPLNDEQTHQLQIVQSSARHLLALINDILDVARIESGKAQLAPEQFLARDVLHEVAEVVHPMAAEKHLSFEVDVPSEMIALNADRRIFRQIILNLANNAVKYTLSGGVRVVLRRCELDSDEALRVDVSDTGIGIKPEDSERLFRAFEKLDATTTIEGTGLGLYLCKQFVDLLGGSLSFTSEVGKGSTFTFVIPLARDFSVRYERN